MPVDAGPLLSVDRLVTHYEARGSVRGPGSRRRASITAVDGVSLTLRSGELVAIVGESGCGKTSLAMSILQMVPVSEGSVRLEGRELSKLSSREMRRARRDLQVVFQDPYESLDPRQTVAETIAEPLRIHGLGGSRAAVRDSVAAAMTRVALTPPELLMDRLPHELSGGQRQRVSIAAALILEPRVLIADEPVSMLDVSVRSGVMAVFDELRHAGLGVLMITHDLSTVARIADRVSVMYLGRVIEEGPAAEVLRNPLHPYTRALVSVVPSRFAGRSPSRQILTGETPDAGAIPVGCRFHPRCPIAQPSCTAHDPQLAPRRGVPEHLHACPVAEGENGDGYVPAIEKAGDR